MHIGDIIRVESGLPNAGAVGEIIDRPDRYTAKVRMSTGEVVTYSPSDLEHAYGACLSIGCRVELSPATDAWMRGARYGTVIAINDKLGNLRVRLDKIRRPITIHGSSLRRIGGGRS